MMNWRTMSVGASLLLMISCATQEEESEQLADGSVEDIEEEQITQDPELEGLELNQGEKWKVDSSTATGMTNIEGITNAFDGEDFKQFGADVHEELSGIINQCNMQGEDHKQYHIILHAMLKEAKSLEKGTSETTDKISHYLESYTAHFEL